MADEQATTEEWRPVPVVRFAHLYSVSSLGRVRSEERIDPNRRSTRVLKARVLVCPVDPAGYRRLVLIDDGERLGVAVHALVAGAFLGDRPDGLTVDHINGVKTDNRVENLRYLSRGDNKRAASALGLVCRGERHHSSKLSAADVLAIRQRRVAGETLRHIAKSYGISLRATAKIVRRLSWQHVP